MRIEHRPFACDKCGAIHQIETNHEGQVYSQKCKNWPCTAGVGSFTSMSFWAGPVEERETNFYAKAGDKDKVRMLFKLEGSVPVARKKLYKVNLADFMKKTKICETVRHKDVFAVFSGEHRPPKKGEWFLSGAVPEAYYAPNDLSTPYYIAKLVEVKRSEAIKVKRFLS